MPVFGNAYFYIEREVEQVNDAVGREKGSLQHQRTRAASWCFSRGLGLYLTSFYGARHNKGEIVGLAIFLESFCYGNSLLLLRTKSLNFVFKS